MNTHQTIQNKILSTFAISLVVASIGAFIGRFVPEGLFLPLIIFEFIILIIALFFRKRKGIIGYPFLYFFTLLTGVTTYPVLNHYTNEIGGVLVGAAFLTTAIVFSVLALYGSVTKRDLSFLGGILLSGLLALVILSIVNIFFPIGTVGTWVITIAGILIFSGYVMYDFNILKNTLITEEEIPLMALNIYLDFLNLFLKILRLFGLISSSKD